MEIAYETTAPPPRIPKAESLGPTGLYAAYAKAVDLPPDVIKLGTSVLEEVAANVAASGRGRDQREVHRRRRRRRRAL